MRHIMKNKWRQSSSILTRKFCITVNDNYNNFEKEGGSSGDFDDHSGGCGEIGDGFSGVVETAALPSVYEIVCTVIPTMFDLIISFTLITINLIFMGTQNDTVAQDAIGLSNLFINILGVGVFFGLNGGLETLASQSIGSKDFSMCGIYLQQGRLINFCFFIPIAACLILSPYILQQFGQNPDVAHQSGIYLRAFMPGILLMGQNDLLTRLLIEMGYSSETMMVNFLGAMVHIFNNYLLVIHFQLGVLGSGLASTFTMLFVCFGLLLFCNYIERQDEDFQKIMAVPLFHKKNLENATQYLKLGLPMVLIMVMDWGNYEILSLWSAAFGVEAQTSVILVWNLVDIACQLELAFQIVICAYVGKQIGAGNLNNARSHQWRIFSIAMAFAFVQFAIMITFRQHLIRMFTNNAVVLEIASHYFICVPFFLLFDFVSQITIGTIKALGLQSQGFYINFATYVVFGLPMAYALAFQKLPCSFIQNNFDGIFGLMFGQTIAVFFNFIALLLVIYGPGSAVNWKKAIQEADQRRDNSHKLIMENSMILQQINDDDFMIVDDHYQK